MANGVSFAGFGVKTDGPVVCLADPTEHRRRITQDAFPPVMSYFEPMKRTSAGHSFVMGQRERWKQVVSTAESIAVVGVRVLRHDEHIWGPLACTHGQITYCGGTSGAAEFKAWASSCRAGRPDTVLHGHFCSDFAAILNSVGL